ncbi:MAG: VWA domain-containing protein [Polyangiaceae bacterium]|nr:VWA domain-containing protein [Polyangiaceae bacterium]
MARRNGDLSRTISLGLALAAAMPACSGTGSSSGGGGGASGGSAATGGASGAAGASAGGAGSGGAGSGGAGSGGGSAAGGAAGAAATGGGGAAGAGAAGGGAAAPSDASIPDVAFPYDGGGGGGGLSQDSACAATSVESNLERQPADIVFVVDNSGSMGTEAGFVQAQMNGFSSQIAASGVDYHVVLISSYPATGNGICIDPPLGAVGCPNQDTNLPRFLHVDLEVGSTDGLTKLITTHGQWSAMMRPSATKHLVIVTDDDSAVDAAAFDAAFRALDASYAGYRFHGIYAFGQSFGDDPFGCGATQCCFQSANEGTVYRSLVAMTGGVEGNLCQQDFAPVFSALATSVITGSQLSCEVPMPTPEAGVVDPDEVKLEFVSAPGALPQELPRVADATACAGGGWYYDTPSTPTRLILCPATCTVAKAATQPRLNVLLGCLGS